MLENMETQAGLEVLEDDDEDDAIIAKEVAAPSSTTELISTDEDTKVLAAIEKESAEQPSDLPDNAPTLVEAVPEDLSTSKHVKAPRQHTRNAQLIIAGAAINDVCDCYHFGILIYNSC